MKSFILSLFLLLLAFSFSSFTSIVKPSTIAKELAFPVAGKKSNIGSFWGENRDGGKRKHEGIDIFAKKGTNVVAICDGIIVGVNNEEVGG